MNTVFRAFASLLLAATLSATAWAAEEPIGALTVIGKATITAGDTSFTLNDQEYAYFSGDRIELKPGGRATITTNDGLKVTFVDAATVSVKQASGEYQIDLEQGAMAVKAGDNLQHRLTHEGETISVDEKYTASDEPYIAAVTNAGDVQFYMPAQLDGTTPWWASLSQAQIAALVAAGVISAAAAANYLDDDDEPSS